MIKKFFKKFLSSTQFRPYLVNDNTKEVFGPVGINFFDYDSLFLETPDICETIPGTVRVRTRFCGTVGAPDMAKSTTYFKIEIDKGCRVRIVYGSGSSTISARSGYDDAIFDFSNSDLKIWLEFLNTKSANIMKAWRHMYNHDNKVFLDDIGSHNAAKLLSNAGNMIRTDSICFNNRLRLLVRLKPECGYIYAVPGRFFDFRLTDYLEGYHGTLRESD